MIYCEQNSGQGRDAQRPRRSTCKAQCRKLAKHFLENRNWARSYENAFSEFAVSTHLHATLQTISQENMDEFWREEAL